MCFEVRPNSKVQIADKDIKCWKRVMDRVDGVYSPIRDYKYIPQEVQPKVKLKKEARVGNDVIIRGYHSYKDKSYSSIIVRAWSNVWMEFIIPKGTRYYDNGAEYVSETIMML